MVLPSVLKKILETKAEEVAAGRYRASRDELRARAADLAPPRAFRHALETRAEQSPAVIAEVKKASPSAGVIRPDFRPAEIAASYEQAGATCLSVLTDRPWFQGDAEYLRAARAACGLPVLRKDFIIDRWQLPESRCLEADCILLIAAALSAGQLQDLHGEARELGLDVLVEVHDEAELGMALGLGEDCLLGVNNRNLHDFVTDLGTSEHLRTLTPEHRLLVAESGIRTPEDVQRLLGAGIRAFLVGEAFMREPDPGSALRALFG